MWLWTQGEKPGKEADFRKGWLHGASLLSHGRASEVPGASKARVSQRGQQRGCGSPHTAWLSWGRKARWEKRLQCRWKKGITASEETAVYQMAFQRARVRILMLEKWRGGVRACSCRPRESKPRPPAHRHVPEHDSQKNGPWEEFGRLAYSDASPEEDSECPAERPKGCPLPGGLERGVTPFGDS